VTSDDFAFNDKAVRSVTLPWKIELPQPPITLQTVIWLLWTVRSGMAGLTTKQLGPSLYLNA